MSIFSFFAKNKNPENQIALLPSEMQQLAERRSDLRCQMYRDTGHREGLPISGWDGLVGLGAMGTGLMGAVAMVLATGQANFDGGVASTAAPFILTNFAMTALGALTFAGNVMAKRNERSVIETALANGMRPLNGISVLSRVKQTNLLRL